LYNSEPFDPKKLTRYKVIRVYYQYSGQQPEEKFFVVLDERYEFNGQLAVFCLKATSKVEKYKNNKNEMIGCVFYEADQITFFDLDTAIQPDNPLPFAYDRLEAFGKSGMYRVEGDMPPDFHEKLIEAIKKSDQLPRKKKAVLLAAIGEDPDAHLPPQK
jgi:hypothetical protein